MSENTITLTVLSKKVRGTMLSVIRFEQGDVVKHVGINLGVMDYAPATHMSVIYGLLHINHKIQQQVEKGGEPKSYNIKVLVHPKSYGFVSKKKSDFTGFKKKFGHTITAETFSVTDIKHRTELHNFIASQLRKNEAQTELPF